MLLNQTANLSSPAPQSQPFAADRQYGREAAPNPAIPVLQRMESRIRYNRGETIFNEGDPAEFTYRVVSGAVRLCKHMSDGRRQIAQFLLPGDYFSFMEMMEHSFTAEAVSDVVLACYPQRQIERMMEERRDLRHFFASLLTRRVKDVQNHLVMLGRQTAKEKMASFLITLIERSGETRDSRLELPMSRQDIADFLGLTIETVCRVLSAMKREKLIDIPGLHELIILNTHRLSAIAHAPL
jgi:CRP/FNR family nitrogen fixation transcriptional regulator